jgi:hypothetical protein
MSCTDIKGAGREATLYAFLIFKIKRLNKYNGRQINSNLISLNSQRDFFILLGFCRISKSTSISKAMRVFRVVRG